jgi:hypothetical protein
MAERHSGGLNSKVMDERSIAYLLGELPKEESERFEDECFDQEDWPEQLNQVEEDLIEDYLRGDLAPERRRLFERNYLTTTARVERVRMAAALLRHVDELGADEEGANDSEGDDVPVDGKMSGGWLSAFLSTHAWAPRAALALGALAVLTVAWWFTRPEPRRAVALLTLSVSSGNRAEGAQPGRVRLTPETGVLRVSLILPEDQPPAARYRVKLEEERGEKETLDVTGQDARTVSVEVSASDLARGQYALTLFTVGGDGTERRVPGRYLFTVE